MSSHSLTRSGSVRRFPWGRRDEGRNSACSFVRSSVVWSSAGWCLQGCPLVVDLRCGRGQGSSAGRCAAGTLLGIVRFGLIPGDRLRWSHMVCFFFGLQLSSAGLSVERLLVKSYLGIPRSTSLGSASDAGTLFISVLGIPHGRDGRACGVLARCSWLRGRTDRAPWMSLSALGTDAILVITLPSHRHWVTIRLSRGSPQR